MLLRLCKVCGWSSPSLALPGHGNLGGLHRLDTHKSLNWKPTMTIKIHKANLSEMNCFFVAKHTRSNTAPVPFMRKQKRTRRKTKAMTIAPSGKLRSRRIRKHSLYSSSASPYRARPSSLRASSYMQSAVGTSSPAQARSFSSRSCRRSRNESAVVSAS